MPGFFFACFRQDASRESTPACIRVKLHVRAIVVMNTWAWPEPTAFHSGVFPWRMMHAPARITVARVEDSGADRVGKGRNRISRRVRAKVQDAAATREGAALGDRIALSAGGFATRYLALSRMADSTRPGWLCQRRVGGAGGKIEARKCFRVRNVHWPMIRPRESYTVTYSNFPFLAVVFPPCPLCLCGECLSSPTLRWPTSVLLAAGTG